MRIIEILVGVNAVCGIIAFLLAKGAIRWFRRQLGLEPKPPQKSIEKTTTGA